MNIKGGEITENVSGIMNFAVGSFISRDGIKYRVFREFTVESVDGSITDWEKVRENTVPDYSPDYPTGYYK